ncbi:hypothetical protein TNCV_3659671 [Trichonephila clavipes]|nr:hypothetical protein TNCV_3659671 [Trichonephila clavipes]
MSQELPDSHKQDDDLIEMHEIEELESFDPAESEDRMLVGFDRRLVSGSPEEKISHRKDSLKPTEIENVTWCWRESAAPADEYKQNASTMLRKSVCVGGNQTTVLRIWYRWMQEVSTRTIRRRLQQSGLTARRPLLTHARRRTTDVFAANGVMKEGCSGRME